MAVKLEDLLDDIKRICEEYNKTFTQVICEAFFIFDDEFEEMSDARAANEVHNLERKLRA